MWFGLGIVSKSFGCTALNQRQWRRNENENVLYWILIILIWVKIDRIKKERKYCGDNDEIGCDKILIMRSENSRKKIKRDKFSPKYWIYAVVIKKIWL